MEHLRGMFAFALWDADRGALLLARDPYGIKPLYVADDGRTVRVASQVKALLAGGGIDTAPEPAGHAGFFLWGSRPGAVHALPRHPRAPRRPHAVDRRRGSAPHEPRPVRVRRPAPSAPGARARPAGDGPRGAPRHASAHHLVADVPGRRLPLGRARLGDARRARDRGRRDAPHGHAGLRGVPRDARTTRCRSPRPSPATSAPTTRRSGRRASDFADARARRRSRPWTSRRSTASTRTS